MKDNKYQSKYSNGKFVSEAQYITELICENKAKRDKLDLHYRFWTNPKWSVFYRNQIGTANKLLKEYAAKAIIKAILDNRAKNIYSLRAPHLLPIIQEYHTKLLSEPEAIVPSIDRSEKSTFRKDTNIKKNIISKLKELDQ